MTKKVLGRGLEALIPQEVMDSVDAGKVVNIPLEKITPNPHQPRKHFDRERIKSLSNSLRKDGVLQPVVVRKKGDGYELIMGERRFQAARLAGVATMPAVVKPVEEVDALRLALTENVQRENLNAIEVAQAFNALTKKFGLTQQELADLVGKDRSSVTNTMRLLALPEEIRKLLSEGKISEGHARALLGLETASQQIAMAKKIVSDNLNVRQVEGVTVAKRKKSARTKVPDQKAAHLTFLENAISQHLSTKVSIDEKRGGKGRMVIEFYSHDDFERLAELLQIPLPR